MRINIKPLSVNEAWMGRRFKTAKYTKFQNDVLFLLPNLTLPEPPYKLQMIVGYSNPAADIDNFVKPFLDILQKKYNFDDKLIYKLEVEKVIVPKGKEFIDFFIETYTQDQRDAAMLILGR
jgi:Holliday junction resolvase RusA-like endonuclease